MSAHLLPDTAEDQSRKGPTLSLLTQAEQHSGDEMGIYLLFDTTVNGNPQSGYTYHDTYLSFAEGVHDILSRQTGTDGNASAPQYRGYKTTLQREHMV